MFKRNRLLIFFIATFLILFSIKYFWVGESQTEYVAHHTAVPTERCFLSQEPCSLDEIGQLSTPSTLVVEQPFDVYFLATQQNDAEPELTFNMETMNMGHNHYTMVKKEGLWKATVTLPRCASGNTQWVMTVKSNKKTANMLLEFPK